MRVSPKTLLAAGLTLAGAVMVFLPGHARAQPPEVILRVPLGQGNRVGCETGQSDAGGKCQKVTGECVKGSVPYQLLYFTDAECNHSVSCAQEQGCNDVYIIGPGSMLANYTKLIYAYLKKTIATLAAVMIVWGGVEWAASGGSQEAITSGKQKILNALLGLGLFILAGLILSTVNPDMFPIA